MKKLLLLLVAVCGLLSCGISQEDVKNQMLAQYEKDRIYDSTVKADLRIQDSLNTIAYKKEQEERQKLIKKSIKITSYYLSDPNSAGGVDAYFYFTNLNDKAIKYLWWKGYPINTVNDAVSCTIRDESTSGGKDTGPYAKGRSGGGCWSCLWYNYSAYKLILTLVMIEYMDGSTLTIEGDDLYLIGKKK